MQQAFRNWTNLLIYLKGVLDVAFAVLASVFLLYLYDVKRMRGFLFDVNVSCI